MAPPAPPFRVDIRRTASRAHRIAPTTLTAKAFAKACAVTVSTRAKPPVTPALFTSALMGPSSRSAVSKIEQYRFGGDVGPDGEGTTAGSDNLAHHFARSGLAAREIHCHREASSAGKLGNRCANAAARPGHDQSSAHFVILAQLRAAARSWICLREPPGETRCRIFRHARA